jgi:hypothetical protein
MKHEHPTNGWIVDKIPNDSNGNYQTRMSHCIMQHHAKAFSQNAFTE